jgi:hypothetical protein
VACDPQSMLEDHVAARYDEVLGAIGSPDVLGPTVFPTRSGTSRRKIDRWRSSPTPQPAPGMPAGVARARAGVRDGGSVSEGRPGGGGADASNGGQDDPERDGERREPDDGHELERGCDEPGDDHP